jgi:glycosyltransferase involved in cell wall biosynthesis
VRLSVVMPCLNAASTIAVQLEALAAQEWSEPWEVIVADNGSTDETLSIVERFRDRLPELTVVDASDRAGQGHAMNVGVHAARGRSVLFCDADDQLAPGWVRAMGEALEQHELVASRQEVEKLNEPWQWQARPPQMTEGLMTLPFPPYLPHAPTSGLGVRRALHQKVGGFDADLEQMQDTDFCIRLQLRGTELHFVPEALVHYRYRTELKAMFAQARGYAEAGALLQKRYGAGDSPSALRWAVKHWRPFVQGLPRILRKSGRADLAWRLGWQVGRYRGSLKYRVRAI